MISPEVGQKKENVGSWNVELVKLSSKAAINMLLRLNIS